MICINDPQYAAFAANIKTLDQLRRNENVSYVPGAFRIEKVLLLSKEDFEKLSEDISPAYPFIRDNRTLMSTDPGGWFHCLLVRTEDEPEGLLVAQGRGNLYLGYAKDCRKLNLPVNIPVEHIQLEEPKAYLEQARFFHKPCCVEDLTGGQLDSVAPEQQTAFQVEKIVILPDEEYRRFKENGLMADQIFLFDNRDSMWFDPGDRCWHCLLVKGESSRDGILVEAEGYSYARYAAHIPDCDRLRLQEAPVHQEQPVRVPRQRTATGRDER